MKQHQRIETPWTKSLVRRQKPNNDDLRNHLRLIHQNHTGFTESFALQCYDSSGRNSYEVLADIFNPTLHSSLLDLACGSGVLLELCHKRATKHCIFTGVDMSPEELALARQRNLGATTNFFEGLAQNLHFINDNSYDLVLCHWALTVMDSVPQVLTEIKRVIHPGGTFSAIVDGDPFSAAGYSEISDIIYNAVRSEYQKDFGLVLGDARVRDSQELIKLAKECFPGATVEVEEKNFHLYGDPAMLARETSGFFYASFIMSTEGHVKMLNNLEDLFISQGKGDGCQFTLPVNQLTIRSVK